jgi:PGF-pre-PGF domain-containing protein
MGKLAEPTIDIHYVNVDMFASGPPDVAFENTASSSTSGGIFGEARRFGSKGPRIYDYVIVSMPYVVTAGSGLNESQPVNITVPNLYYDDMTTLRWNLTTNGTNITNLVGNFSEYTEKQSEWEVLLGTNNCTNDVSEFNATNPCYIDTSNNKVWVRLPHFSGTGPSVSGSVVASSGNGGNGGSGGGGGGAGTNATTTEKKSHTWATISMNQETTMTVGSKTIGLEEITFVAREALTNVGLEVLRVENVSTSTVLPYSKPQNVYKYMIISPNGMTSQNVMQVRIKFSVAKSWLVNYRRENIKLYRFSNGWTQLNTTYLTDDSEYDYFTAESPGFSDFAIVAEEPVVEEEEEVVGEVISETDAIEEKGIDYIVWIIITVLVLATAYLVYNIVIHSRSKEDKFKPKKKKKKVFA